MRMAKDIERYISNRFPDAYARRKVYKILEPIIQRDWNVGTNQLIRSLLVLSEGDLAQLNVLVNFKDPRDILVQAEEKRGHPGDYGNALFPSGSI